ncbi:MAG: RNA 3'-terminal phosphate cyclase [Armatimonadota bacterium]
MIVIDGSYGEGGGQIVRTSLTLSAILKQPIRIENIRAGRKKPGLQPQHLTAAQSISSICNGRLTGDKIGSQTLEFCPGNVKPGKYTFDVSKIKSSAGSVNLIFQTLLLPLAFAKKPSTVTIRGGTHVPWSPSSNYISEVYLPTLARMGLLVSYRLKRAGYYPIGGGEIEAEIRPVDHLQPIDLSKRKPGAVTCCSAVSNLSRSIADRQMAEMSSRLKLINIEPDEVIEEYDSPGRGTFSFILFDGGDMKAGFTSLGEIRKSSEDVAKDACDKFTQWWKSGMALDKHLADQMIVPMALADGESLLATEENTLHLRTNIWTVGHFLKTKFDIQGNPGEPSTIRVIGNTKMGD